MTQEGDEIKLLVLSRTRIQTADFINSIANYLAFETFEKAASNPVCLINTPFTEIFKFNIKSLHVQEKSMSCWSREIDNDPKTYIFHANNRNLKLTIIESEDDYKMNLNLNGILLLLADVLNEMPVYIRFIERYIPASKSILVKKIFFINTLGIDNEIIEEWSEKVANILNLNPLNFKENIIIMDNTALKHLIFYNRKFPLSEKEIALSKTNWPKYRDFCFNLLNRIEQYDFTVEKTLEVIESILELLVEHSIVIQLNYLEVSYCKRVLLDQITSTKTNELLITVPLRKLDKTLNKLPATICRSYQCGLIKVGNTFVKMGYSTCHDRCDCTKNCIVLPASKDECNICQCLYKYHAKINYKRTNYCEVITSDSVDGLREKLESKLSILINAKMFVIKSLAVFHIFKQNSSPNTPNFYKNFIKTEKLRYVYYDKIVYDTLDKSYSDELALLQKKTQITKDYVWSILNKLYDLDHIKEIIDEIIKESPKSREEEYLSFPTEQDASKTKALNIPKPTVTYVKGTDREIKNWCTNIVLEENKVVPQSTVCPGFEIPVDFHKMRTSTEEVPKYEKNFSPALTAQTQNVSKEQIYAPDKDFKDFKDVFGIIENIKLTQRNLSDAQNCLDKQNKNLLYSTHALKETVSLKGDSFSKKLIELFTYLEKAVNASK